MEPIIKRRNRGIHHAGDDGANKSTTKPDNKASSEQRLADKEDRENLVLWKQPIATTLSASAECVSLLVRLCQKLREKRTTVLAVSLATAGLYYLYITDGPHSALLRSSEKEILWGLYWVWLGVLSSVGLGTGLHTFLLFLGPFIARVTLAAYECGTTDFPEPPYPNEVNCPAEHVADSEVTIWAIMAKVRFPAMCWGAGTALGELPPYFMARAARLTGAHDEDDEDLNEFQELLDSQKDGNQSGAPVDMMTRGKLFMHDLVHRMGFFGILAAASIPNPLFDLAGITCGHFLVPFWTFFGATLIGKAVVKMHIQKVFIIFLFSKHHVDSLLDVIKSIPVIGDLITDPIESFFTKQRAKLRTGSSDGEDGGNAIGQVFELFIFAMVAYFIVTIVNSLAQSRLARAQKKRRDAN